MGPHDSAYKLLFSHPYLVESLLRGFVPGEWIEQLDFESLESVREGHPRDDLGIRSNDMIWRLRWRGDDVWIYLYLMLEFQSSHEPFMAVRALDYNGGLYRQIVKTLEPRSRDKLPLVLPLVIYRGQPEWTAATEVFDLLSPAPAEIEPYLPHLRYLLLDANAYPATQLEAMHNPVACLLWLEANRELNTGPIDELVQLLDAPQHNELRHAFRQWLTQVFLPSRIPGAAIPEVKKLEEVSSMIAENTINWLDPVRERASKKGRQEGEAAMLLRLMERRFGELSSGVEERVRGAEASALREWADRLLSATTLDEVFDDS